MKYSKEYQDHMRYVVNVFSIMITHDVGVPVEERYTPAYKRIGDTIVFDFETATNGCMIYVYDRSSQEMDGVTRTSKDVVEAWMKIENEHAVAWLAKNAITYEEWLKFR